MRSSSGVSTIDSMGSAAIRVGSCPYRSSRVPATR
ncbi:Uncharacterised protein [Mycobacteroides abscessus subsp. abscessus]|nr:Uncharacterised protein [Mycobacteroides abscessus subsp. abscessus]